jgi:hypothetical protein
LRRGGFVDDGGLKKAEGRRVPVHGMIARSVTHARDPELSYSTPFVSSI